MDITLCTIDDVTQILNLYEQARSFQRQKKMVVWPPFDSSIIQMEIQEQRQYKIEIDGEIACNWTITYEDPDIWEEKDNQNAIYIHRLCTNEKHRGNKFSEKMVDWAIHFVRKLGRDFVRLDTLGNNVGLIKHYTGIGFDYLGPFTLSNTAQLPKHYQDEKVCLLFELDVNK